MSKKTKKLPKISTTNTKQQILDAYNEALEQIDNEESQYPKNKKTLQDNQTIIQNATDNSSQKIIEGLAKLKINTNDSINQLGDQLTTEFNRLTEIHQAIVLEQKHIEDLYGVKETANTLSALIYAQDKKKKEFELEIEESKILFEKEKDEKCQYWQKENTKLETEHKELKESIEKQKKKEEEEYQYNLKITRRKEQDGYDLKKSLKEKELIQKEETILQKEEEFTELQKQAQEFPQQINDAIQKTKKDITQELDSQYKFEVQLKAKEVQGDQKLKEQKIESLSTKIKEQEATIKQLTEKTNQATSQVQDIANRALDTSQRMNYQVVKPANQDRAEG